jgi:hypothetical protein
LFRLMSPYQLMSWPALWLPTVLQDHVNPLQKLIKNGALNSE